MCKGRAQQGSNSENYKIKIKCRSAGEKVIIINVEY
jgi:hypothetical protein